MEQYQNWKQHQQQIRQCLSYGHAACDYITCILPNHKFTFYLLSFKKIIVLLLLPQQFVISWACKLLPADINYFCEIHFL